MGQSSIDQMMMTNGRWIGHSVSKIKGHGYTYFYMCTLIIWEPKKNDQPINSIMRN